MNYAGFWPRLMAHNIDLLILLPTFYLCSVFIDDNLTLSLTCLILSYLYESLFISVQGSTVGKRIMKVKVVNAREEKIPLSLSLFRSLVKIPSCLTFFIGFLVIGLHPQKKSIHDMLSGTFVIISSDK